MTQLQAERKAAKETRRTGEPTLIYIIGGVYDWTLLSLYESDKAAGLSYAAELEIDCIIRKE